MFYSRLEINYRKQPSLFNELDTPRRKQIFTWNRVGFPPLSDGMCCCGLSLPEVIRRDGSLLNPFCLFSLSPLSLCYCGYMSAPARNGCSKPQLLPPGKSKRWFGIVLLPGNSVDFSSMVFFLKVTPSMLKVALSDCWLLFCTGFDAWIACW